MTAYTVRHRTTYTYGSDVAYSRLLAHVVPRATDRQRLLGSAITVEPAPVRRFERADYFGNTASWFVIDEPHETLEVLAESHVAVEPVAVYAAGASAPWEDVRASFEPPVPPELFDVVQFTFDTPLTETDRTVVTYARESFSRGRPLFECVLEVNTRIHHDFAFDKEATDTHTTVRDAFELRAGVCQDLAHVGIACVRSMGLAARYVSGYLLTQPPPGRERLIGADASHAWFSVWIPPFGWIDFDPTNDMLPSSEHITVAWGREYGDVTPVHGIITGGSEHEVDVAVDVIPDAP
jgi:transglutaminase-like putative cysteine protease